MIWSLAFWKGAAERAIKTAAQVLAAVFVVGVPILDVDIAGAVGLVATAVVASLLTSILSADFVAGVPDAVALAIADNIRIAPGPMLPEFVDPMQRHIPASAGGPAQVKHDDSGAPYLADAEPESTQAARAAARAAKIARARGDA